MSKEACVPDCHCQKLRWTLMVIRDHPHYGADDLARAAGEALDRPCPQEPSVNDVVNAEINRTDSPVWVEGFYLQPGELMKVYGAKK